MRFEYCKYVYDRQTEMIAAVERKAQFYFSFTTVFLGAALLNIDSLSKIRILLSPALASIYAAGVLLALFILFAASLALSLFCVLRSLHVRRFKSGYPSDLSHKVFLPGGEFLTSGGAGEFLRTGAMHYAVAVDENRFLIDLKAKWLARCSNGLLSAVLSLLLAVCFIGFALLG